MKIEPKSIKVRDIFESYADNGDDGVFAYGGKLAIRPAYQREFIYDAKQAESVIHTVLKGFPLNVMYWVKVGNDAYALLDGQQRTLSVMQYLKHQFPITIDGRKYYWDALPDDKYNAIMNYEFMIYICEGDSSEKLSWFTVVNIAGEKLSNQELLNSSYTGVWLSDAKRYFSKRNCAAKGLSDKYIKGDPNRQELLEKALKGICEYQGMKEITEYMAVHKSDKDADELWQYFQDVIGWVTKIFPKYYSDMKGLDWCHLYNKYHKNLCRETDPFAERLLNLRTFDKRDKMAAYSKQDGICPICGNHFEFEEMEGDHIKPWSKGGHTTSDNCQMLCKDCNGKKTDKY